MPLKPGQQTGFLLLPVHGVCRSPTLTMSLRCVVQLMTHREDVDTINLEALKRLPGAPILFHAQDAGASTDLLKAACPVRSCCARCWGCSLVLALYLGMLWHEASTLVEQHLVT